MFHCCCQTLTLLCVYDPLTQKQVKLLVSSSVYISCSGKIVTNLDNSVLQAKFASLDLCVVWPQNVYLWLILFDTWIKMLVLCNV